MGLANCRYCGALFHTFSGQLECPACLALEHAQLDVVRQYVRSTQERSVPVIAADTGIEASRIVKWLRERRLPLNVVPGELRCYRCDAGIGSGRFCESCQRKLSDDLAAQRDHRVGRPTPNEDEDVPRGFVRGRREAGPSPEYVPPKTKHEADKPPSGMHLRG